MNKNISIWRGSDTPPTLHHIWVKEDGSILNYNNGEWTSILDSEFQTKIEDYISKNLDNHSFNYFNLINKPSVYHLGDFNNINDVYTEAAKPEIYTDFRKNILTYTIKKVSSSNVMSSGIIFQNHFNASSLDYRICTQYMLFDGGTRTCYVRTFNCNQLSDTTPSWDDLKIYSDYVVEDNKLYGLTIADESNNSLTKKVELFEFPSLNLPTASNSTLGGIKVGNNLSINNGVLSANYSDATETKAGLMSADDKKKLNTSNIYKHHFTALSNMNFTQEAWCSIANIQDTESSIIQVSTGGHSDVICSVSTGWQDTVDGALTILNSFTFGANPNHAHVKAVRLRKEDRKAKIEVLINKPIVNSSNYVNIVVSIFTNAGHNPIVINSQSSSSIQIVNNVSDSTIVQSFVLEDKAIMAKRLVADEILAAIPMIKHGTSDTTFTLTPNKLHVWDEIGSLTVTLNEESINAANKYIFQFSSGNTPTQLIYPDSIKWANGIRPTINANSSYLVKIINNLGTFTEFK